MVVPQNDWEGPPTDYERGSDIPADPTPSNGKGIPFSIEVPDFSTEFIPVYYPERYTDTMEKDVEKNARQCKGEDVTIDTVKNPEFHATGILLAENVESFRRVRKHNGPVILQTPLTDNFGGMEVVITKGEIGEIQGWDGMYDQWQFSYTLDMVGTGDDVDKTGKNQVVSEVIELAEQESNADDLNA